MGCLLWILWIVRCQHNFGVHSYKTDLQKLGRDRWSNFAFYSYGRNRVSFLVSIPKSTSLLNPASGNSIKICDTLLR